jgi:hypothetical protein
LVSQDQGGRDSGKPGPPGISERCGVWFSIWSLAPCSLPSSRCIRDPDRHHVVVHDLDLARMDPNPVHRDILAATPDRGTRHHENGTVASAMDEPHPALGDSASGRGRLPRASTTSLSGAGKIPRADVREKVSPPSARFRSSVVSLVVEGHERPPLSGVPAMPPGTSRRRTSRYSRWKRAHRPGFQPSGVVARNLSAFGGLLPTASRPYACRHGPNP